VALSEKAIVASSHSATSARADGLTTPMLLCAAEAANQGYMPAVASLVTLCWEYLIEANGVTKGRSPWSRCALGALDVIAAVEDRAHLLAALVHLLRLTLRSSAVCALMSSFFLTHLC
jgi:hypothetical protein